MQILLSGQDAICDHKRYVYAPCSPAVDALVTKICKYPFGHSKTTHCVKYPFVSKQQPPSENVRHQRMCMQRGNHRKNLCSGNPPIPFADTTRFSLYPITCTDPRHMPITQLFHSRRFRLVTPAHHKGIEGRCSSRQTGLLVEDK